jgi:hypothetical protein
LRRPGCLLARVAGLLAHGLGRLSCLLLALSKRPARRLADAADGLSCRLSELLAEAADPLAESAERLPRASG